jgi:hypothetical protein
MTLRDKIVDIIWGVRPLDVVDDLEKIADDYATDFKKWCDLNKSIIHTDEELLEIFKKEKGL